MGSEHGQWFVRGCRLASRIFPSEMKWEKKRRERYMRLKSRYMSQRKRALAMPIEEQRQIERRERRLSGIDRKLDALERWYVQPSFKQAIAHTGMNVGLYSVRCFALLASLIVFFTSLLLLFFLFKEGEGNLFILPAVLLLPMVTYAFLMNYPEILSKRLIHLSIGRSPEVINYMAMAMRLTPSLDRAMKFAAENCDEPFSSSIRKALWNVQMRRRKSIEEGFDAYTNDVGEWNEDLKHALYALRSATLERDRRGIEQALDKAQSIILTGTKMQIERFASKLTAPTTILFVLGVLMPMILGSMLPLLTLNLPSVSTAAVSTAAEANPPSPINIILLMDVLFPAITLTYAYYILGKRPSIAHQKKITPSSKAKILKNGVVCGFFGAFTFAAGSVLNIIPNAFLMVLTLGWGMGLFLLLNAAKSVGEIKKIEEMEEDLPDALFQIGSMVGEGEPLERAFKKVGDSMKDRFIGKLLTHIAHTTLLTRRPLEDVLFSRDGVLSNVPSRTIHASLRIAAEVTKKDAVEAGQTIITVSNYLRDMRKVEHDVKARLNSTVEMMRATALFFAPLVMGITAAMYVLLSAAFSALQAPPISPQIFFLVLGVYLLLTVISITYFTNGIERGVDRAHLMYSIGMGMPIASTIYVFTALMAMKFMM